MANSNIIKKVIEFVRIISARKATKREKQAYKKRCPT